MKQKNEKTLLIIDGNSLINRAFYALPPLSNREGQHTNAVYGFLTMLFKAMDEVAPAYAAVAFDLKAPTFRHDSFKEYKAGRKKMPAELAEQIQPLKDVLDAMGLYRMELEGFEADDLIGTLARQAEEEGLKVVIVSGDKDVLQLVTETTRVMITKKGISQVQSYDSETFESEYEIPVHQFIDLKGLMGDPSDNIPGIQGVGPKTATKLIKDFGTIENLLENSHEVANKKLREKLETYGEDAVLSKKLATIMTHVPVEMELASMKIGDLRTEEAVEIFKRLEFASLLERITSVATGDKSDDPSLVSMKKLVQTKDLQGVAATMRQDIPLVWYSLVEKLDKGKTRVVAVAFGQDEHVWWMDLRQADLGVMDSLKQWVEQRNMKKILHDIKQEKRSWKAHGAEFQGDCFDVMIADYLVNPSKNSYALEDLSLHHFGEKTMSDKDLWGTGNKRKDTDLLEAESLERVLNQRINVILRLYPMLEKELHSLDMGELMYDMEIPLAHVLADMEHEGIQVDTTLLGTFQQQYGKRIDEISGVIEALAGRTFNLNSPKQLGEVLFDDLKLPPVKKTKTGYSTDVEVLEKLKDEHEIIPLILEYRQMTKIKGTYIDGLLAIVNPDTGRIHSTFNQTVAATGRISSTDPNLQNIPIRTEMGRQLRRVFVAREGWKLVDADYSQIELRIMAHLSADPGFIAAFQEEADIHTRTAAEIFGVREADVTPEMRSSAKAVNFGIIYGISDFGLSNNLHISRQEARRYIDSYLDRYTKVKGYMESIVASAREKGYVTTLFHRIRHLPELNSTNFNTRSFGERMAMNTPIQGSAADIIKIAMVRVVKELQKGNYQAKLILQVHDELIIEAPDTEVQEVSQLLRKAMEGAVQLDVPLKVDLSVAQNWFDAK